MPEKIYEAITRDIRAKIDEGIYPAGTRLPSVGAISKEYLCSAAPARAALESLKNQGILRSLRGSGYFVLEAAATENGLNFSLIQAGPTSLPDRMEIGLRLSAGKPTEATRSSIAEVSILPSRRNWNHSGSPR